MDKIVEIKNSKHLPDSNTYRFQCDCLHAADALDITVEDNAKKGKYITLTFDIRPQGVLGRIKSAWRLLTGSWVWNEFTVREEDFEYLSMIFNPEKKLNDLP